MNRRHFLQGAGVLLTLPMLETYANEKSAGVPLRLMFIGFPWGVTNKDNWFPNSTGKNFQITKGLKPLEKHKDDLTIFKNISPLHNAHHPHNTLAYYLTCMNFRQPKDGAYDLISCDQLAAEKLGKDTRYSSLQLSCLGNEGAGAGLSLSWDKYGKPVPGYTDPVALFNELFGDGKVTVEQRRQMIQKERSIMDAFRYQSRLLEKRVSKTDKDKLDEYFTSIRHIEKNLAKSEQWIDTPKPKAGVPRPKKGLQGKEQIKVMYDLMVAALQTDLTRVISYRQPLNALLKELSLSNAHPINHHGGNSSLIEQSIIKDQAQSELFSYLIDRLKATKDFDGLSLFDNTILTYGSGVRSGHMNAKLPLIVTGGGQGKIKPAGYVELQEGKNRLSNLWLTLLQSAGLEMETFSHSNSLIEQIRA
ncbi:hypothetical protein LNTAR_19432 [Lentisphaera araneosa HTCC2155]|uniref:Secreted protein containing DUF1552 n=1 Tax=Lentisphaera araneosa HTCC2155 TaxID=313628 RepID=A6DQV2_9BACT|nr:DUF1552 domain-containing protein [Lentisphaera araneosa]EDM26002.1 hypothetical protein LNTAR_19432 [Lentisphaera araneosa HTCC2155]